MIYYYLYKITNKINNQYYYGVHATTDLDDGYMGSGQALWKAYSKYGLENFDKEILEYFNDSESMFTRESEIVTQELVDDKKCYNLCLGGN